MPEVGMFRKVLLVDDDENILQGYLRNLRRGFAVQVATGGAEAIRLLESQGPFALLVADMRMPGMSGLELLEVARMKWPGMIRVMLTGNADQKTAVEAVNRGQVFRFLNKPCLPEDLARVIEAGLRQHQLQEAERELLEKTLTGSLQVLTDLLSLIDPPSFGWSQVVKERARIVAQSLGFGDIWCLEIAALLAPIGRLALPREVAQATLSDDRLPMKEYEMLRRVPEVGANLLASIPRMEGVVEIIRYQSKGFDGEGFPEDGVRGEDIPLGARILRPLLDFMAIERIRGDKRVAMEALKLKGECYDPAVLQAVEACLLGHAAPGPVLHTVLPCPIRSLQAGHCLAENLTTATGKVLLHAGTHLRPPHLLLIRDAGDLLGLQEPAYIVPEGE